MTVNELHKRLSKAIAAGNGRKQVNVAKHTFHHNCEGDGVTHLRVEDTDLTWIYLADDDGGVATRKDGQERGSMTFVLYGDLYDPQSDRASKP